MIPESERWWEKGVATDVLETLAQLPNDEVLTPPKVARHMLASLPSYIWEDPQLTWCDPFSKSGVFLREVYMRLMRTLEYWERDPALRREHILKNMIFASGITRLTAEVTRRTLYQTNDARGHGVIDLEARNLLVEFESSKGNVWYERGDHIYEPGRTACKLCGGNKKVIEIERENFAYPLLHSENPFDGGPMKFDIIVGNPPYQIGMKDQNGERTKNITPLYNRFVEKAIQMEPKYVLMITPSRWFTGGKNLGPFRQRMLEDRRLSKIVDYPNGKEIFPTVDVKGGISYFLWDRDHDGDCEFTQIVDGQIVSRDVRDLRDGDGVLVRDALGLEIVNKVRHNPKFKRSLEDSVSTQDPFGGSLKTNYSKSKPEAFAGGIPLIFKHKVE